MDPTVISSTQQSFQGVTYYFCGRYFQNKTVRLHRAVWEANNGPIPAGHDVHHRNEDRTDNRNDNLQLLTEAEHHRLHGKTTTEAQRKARRSNVRHARAGNAKIPADARSAASKEGWKAVTRALVRCRVCNREFDTPFPTRAKHCGPACSQKALRLRRKAGL